ncbi:VOC family protein [Burkholderia gladioli pv. gladioli]|uniref:Glyoxalase/Bleomycin resistance /Dioxygenase superfamily protein n=1 Tax=Burkholderia gladioli TaxID=28095 RepID=A0A095HDV5_BURGA|nr:VOC family protein [Burkholderia gladioli]ASD79964.1 metapyrocatechase [Burkholderia gladioli pv. gladioli]AWY54790.1 metapyrocatechase [Burkholderia gladioli pv. gladioli]KGC11744.1 glyoxalase/Bleomycin resistance /Dioxygenase superfamily protein [Burkholderia gladioli]MDJ1164220.1 VOC family protein [Burkholderia gladioli pv. gladioli]PEH37804.1 metapyrocatechase [Burkholderia gladioli]
MTTQTGRRPNTIGVHSVHEFVFSVPDLGEAERFYTTFGLDVRRHDDRLDLYTYGHSHRWASVHLNAERKRLEYVSFGIFAQDLEAFRSRITYHGLEAAPHRLSDGAGIWLRSPDGTLMRLLVVDKVSPDEKSQPTPARPVTRGRGAAPSRGTVAPVRPRRLSHILLFSPDVLRMVSFCEAVLGMRLSDRSGDLVAFLHGQHGSDHHLVAFAKSTAPGLHHSSWDVGSIDEVGAGSEQMRNAGYLEGWGVGRHVLGSNYFYYVRDPWGSFAEYSFDIDYVPNDIDWPSANHAPEDSLYVWGPAVPDYFFTNFEQAAT